SNWPQGCCQHLRTLFQWKPSCESSCLTCSTGGSANSIQIHLPTTLASSYWAGIQRFSFSSTFPTGRLRLKSRWFRSTYGLIRAPWVTVSAVSGAFAVSVSANCSVRFLSSDPVLLFVLFCLLVFMVF